MIFTKMDIEPYNEKDEPHGYWVIHDTNGTLWFRGSYLHGIKHGYWETYPYEETQGGVTQYYHINT